MANPSFDKSQKCCFYAHKRLSWQTSQAPGGPAQAAAPGGPTVPIRQPGLKTPVITSVDKNHAFNSITGDMLKAWAQNEIDKEIYDQDGWDIYKDLTKKQRFSCFSKKSGMKGEMTPTPGSKGANAISDQDEPGTTKGVGVKGGKPKGGKDNKGGKGRKKN